MDKDLQRRVIFGGIALAIFIPILMMGGPLLQIGMGLLAMLGVHELLQMKGLRTTTLEGILAMLAAFVLTIPLENYLKFLPVDGNVVAYSLVVFILLGSTVLGKHYSFEDAAYPIAASFYVGIGFQNLLTARQTSVYIVFLALFIVWATDIGAYAFGRSLKDRFPQKLLPSVSPNKTVVGSVGGIVSAIVVALVMYFLFTKELPQIGFVKLVIFTIIFSVVGQIGDLVESSIKRHFGVKDSGKILPGHGGILDRFDNLIFVFPIMHLLGLF